MRLFILLGQCFNQIVQVSLQDNNDPSNNVNQTGLIDSIKFDPGNGFLLLQA